MTQPNPTHLGERTLSALASAKHVVDQCIEKHLRITTMESCTGGMLANLITSVPGASEVLTHARITYANEAKVAAGVPQSMIETYSVYSTEVAEAMAKASIEHADDRTIGIGITGSLSRVDPHNEAHSVPGEVHTGIAYKNTVTSKTCTVPEANRYEAKLHIAELLLDELIVFISKQPDYAEVA